MLIRRYSHEDIQQILDVVQVSLSVTQFRDIHFSREKLGRLLESNVNNSLIFVSIAVEDNGEIVGIISASVNQFIFSYEVVIVDHIFYVKPGRRGLKIATGLVGAYLEWAKERKPRRIQLSNSMGNKIEGFAKLAKRLGFDQVGTIHQMRF